jgi:hypothetical protein
MKRLPAALRALVLAYFDDEVLVLVDRQLRMQLVNLNAPGIATKCTPPSPCLAEGHDLYEAISSRSLGVKLCAFGPERGHDFWPSLDINLDLTGSIVCPYQLMSIVARGKLQVHDNWVCVGDDLLMPVDEVRYACTAQRHVYLVPTGARVCVSVNTFTGACFDFPFDDGIILEGPDDWPVCVPREGGPWLRLTPQKTWVKLCDPPVGRAHPFSLNGRLCCSNGVDRFAWFDGTEWQPFAQDHMSYVFCAVVCMRDVPSISVQCVRHDYFTNEDGDAQPALPLTTVLGL